MTQVLCTNPIRAFLNLYCTAETEWDRWFLHVNAGEVTPVYRRKSAMRASLSTDMHHAAGRFQEFRLPNMVSVFLLVHNAANKLGQRSIVFTSTQNAV